MESSYPLFEFDDLAEAWEKSLEQAIPKILPLFFSKNRRFFWIQNYSSLSLVDYLGIYEEGDWCALTIVKVDFLDKPSIHIFLPITATIPNQLQVSDEENVAFGIRTESAFHGIRNWKIMDAFTGYGFPIRLPFQLSQLFYKDEDICDYIELHESKIGKFDFHLKNELENKLWEMNMQIKILTSGETQINYGITYSLIFPATLYSIKPMDLELSNEIIGNITYSTAENTNLLIALLKRQ